MTGKGCEWWWWEWGGEEVLNKCPAGRFIWMSLGDAPERVTATFGVGDPGLS